ncbi:MAG TPA: HAMP domain-containing methyl-accepting chemotaxis protein [Terriglobales bacterium]|nr:HAMP domain-containing methyl-accepting chemotaxis protein [Terriglobales bacterium]
MFGFGIITALAFISAAIAIMQLRQIGRLQLRMRDVRLPATLAIDELNREVVNGSFQYRNYIIYGEDPELAQKYDQARIEAWNVALAQLQELKRLAGEQDQPLLQQLDDHLRNGNIRIQEDTIHGFFGHGEAARKQAFDTMKNGSNLVQLTSADCAEVRKRIYDALHSDQAALMQAQSRAEMSITLLALLIGAGGALLGWHYARSLSRPIVTCTELMGRVGQGDVTRDVPQELCERTDELGGLAMAMQRTTERLRKLIREVSNGVETVASSATQLSAASSQTASSVKAMSEKSSTVAAAAEEACATAATVSGSMEKASANLTSVAGATEEMSSTVAEIASNSEKARVISEKAMAQAQTISTIMAELGRAAQEIGKVTETITDISAQTNLLALNATIEAARAGTAGKGFAVVANEIKELAKQTSEATEDIKAKIAGVQNSTTGAVQTIETITGVIKEIGNTVASTAAAIEEQATVTKNVAGEIAQATAVVREVNDQVAQTATVSRSIASDIAMVNSATAGIREGGEQVQSSAHELSRLSEQLKVLVAQFSV